MIVPIVLLFLAHSHACSPISTLAFPGQNEVIKPVRPGFSRACRGPRTVETTVNKSPIVVEAAVIRVSPPRNNIYAVTLQVKKVYKTGNKTSSVVGPKLQLLFIKPVARFPRPELRALPTTRRYKEACIYEMDLKKGKKYALFLEQQNGVEAGSKLSRKGRMARYVMTAPPLLQSRKTERKIKAITCPNCGRKPAMKSLKREHTKKRNERIRLTCRVRGSPAPQITWTKNGQPIEEIANRISIRQRKTRSILLIKKVTDQDNGEYTCVAANTLGQTSKTYQVKTLKNKSTTPSPTTTTTTTQATPTTTPLPLAAGAQTSCPISGYCLNGSTCSYIPWLGEMSCSCAPGFRGQRCDRKTTSALYSSLSMSTALCYLGISNPYYPCKDLSHKRMG